MDLVRAAVAMGRTERSPGGFSNAMAVAVLAAGIAAWVPMACAFGAPRTPLGATFATPEAAARAVLDGLADADHARLRSLALSEREFSEHVWPELPASRPERNLSVDYVWYDLGEKSDRYLRQALARHGQERLKLRRLSFRGETTQYRSFLVHRKAVLVVENAAGEEEEMRLFGSLLEKGGRFKIFSYVID